MRLFEKALLNIESEELQYCGFTADEHWNGWERPYFERAVAEQILKDYAAANSDIKWWFSESRSAFYLSNVTDVEMNDIWYAQTIKFDGVELIVYAVGNGSWRWDKIDVDKQIFDGICPNCTSEMLVKQQTIRGVIRKRSDSTTIEMVDYTVEKTLFTECEDCGHRWEEAE